MNGGDLSAAYSADVDEVITMRAPKVGCARIPPERDRGFRRGRLCGLGGSLVRLFAPRFTGKPAGESDRPKGGQKLLREGIDEVVGRPSPRSFTGAPLPARAHWSEPGRKPGVVSGAGRNAFCVMGTPAALGSVAGAQARGLGPVDVAGGTAVRDGGSVFRSDSPSVFSSMRWLWCTSRSRIASARVGSPR